MTLNTTSASVVLKMRRGDEFDFDIVVRDTVTGLPVDVTGQPFWFTAKKSLFDTDDEAQIKHDSNEGGIVLVDPTNGRVRVLIDETDTEDLDVRTVLRWDVQWRDLNDNLKTLASGDLVVELDVTRRTTT